MISRKDFLKSSLLTGLATALPFSTSHAMEKETDASTLKHWVWIRPDVDAEESALHTMFKKYYDAGIRAVLIEQNSEKHFRIAKEHGLEAHRWMWTFNRPYEELMEAHPEWYAVNRNGVSCIEDPPYVDHYRWLCPSKDEVKQYLQQDVDTILSNDYVDGIHLDYVRFCDVILPVNLWDKYDIVQTKEMPEYDFCYCEDCQREFEAWHGQDIMDIEYPSASPSWRLYRYHAIANIVNSLSTIAHKHKKDITAAVFPTPEIARRLVRQDWTNFDLDGVCPMIYQGFYKETIPWIGDAVTEGVNWLNGDFPLYAGLFLPDFNTQDELEQGMAYALNNGARGISLFGEVTDDSLKALTNASAIYSG